MKSFNRCEHFIEINSAPLSIPLDHQSSLVLGDVAVFIVFDLEYPFEANRPTSLREVSQVPGVVGFN
jgi:hypothetical protein